MKDTTVCKNPWCKGHFEYTIVDGEEPPKICPKCKSFDSELSDGVVWKDKEYEGSRFDNKPHRVNISIRRNY